MRQDHCVKRVDGERKFAPVAQPEVLGALKEPTIDQYANAGAFEQVPRAGYCFGGPQKGQFHCSSLAGLLL
jgi:hypothetical protein